MRRLGIAFTGQPHSVREIVRAAIAAEAAGFDSVWVAEDYWTGRDGIAAVACIAYATERIRIGTSVVNPYTRSPVLLAMTLNALYDLAPDRLILGIGAGTPWWPAVQPALLRATSPVETMRETIGFIRALFAGQTVSWNGEPVTLEPTWRYVTGVAAAPRTHISIEIGGIGRRMIELAGEHGDGLLLGLSARPDQAAERIRRARSAALGASRRADAFEAVKLVLAAPGQEGRGRLNTLRHVARVVAEMDAPTVTALGFDPERVARIRAAFTDRRYDDAAGDLTRAMISPHAAVGSVEDCRATLDAFAAVGADVLVLTSFGADISSLIELGRGYVH